MTGWIKAHRAMLENPIVLKDAEHFAVWMWLLMNATHENRDIWFSGERKTLQPGQLVTGRRKIAETLKISESKVQRILSLFEREKQIEQITTNKNRLITIISWLKYQSNDDEKDINGDAKDDEIIPKRIPRSSVITPTTGPIYFAESEQQVDRNISVESNDIKSGSNASEYSCTTGTLHPSLAENPSTNSNYSDQQLDTNRTATEQQLNTKQECKNNKNEIINKEREVRESASHFDAPTLSQVKEYIAEENCSIDASVFYWYYESRDWFTGKNKMKNWKKTIKTWEARERKTSHPPVAAPPLSPKQNRVERLRHNRQIQNRINEIWNR